MCLGWKSRCCFLMLAAFSCTCGYKFLCVFWLIFSFLMNFLKANIKRRVAHTQTGCCLLYHWKEIAEALIKSWKSCKRSRQRRVFRTLKRIRMQLVLFWGETMGKKDVITKNNEQNTQAIVITGLLIFIYVVTIVILNAILINREERRPSIKHPNNSSG